MLETVRKQDPFRDGAPVALQVFTWMIGFCACIVGMLNLIGEWSHELAFLQLTMLAIAPISYMMGNPLRWRILARLFRWRRSPQVQSQQSDANSYDEICTAKVATSIDWMLSISAGLLSLLVCSGLGANISHLPPAYHDEYSYLYQAQTLLAGRFSYPSPIEHPELFDQMHILNEGKMASRYYPGTGLWLAPFVWIGHPYRACWIAASLSTVLIYWVGRELEGRRTGCIASLALALSPGVGIFANMLLAHLPTLLGLSLFLLGIIRWRRTRSICDSVAAGFGLSFAMLCRPMTAAGFGLPFGIDVFIWLLWPASNTPQSVPPSVPSSLSSQKWKTLFGLGLPLISGWILMLFYNRDVTGQWLYSPYQLYTDVYTPRHVYGFNNVVRGEQHLGPRVIDSYDRWAQNLTWELATQNVLVRWLASWLWIFDILPLLMATTVLLAHIPQLDRRWQLVCASIFSLHAVHVPYWYTGIMGWHYVFETAPLWCLVLAGATSILLSGWKLRERPTMGIWWYGLLGGSLLSVYVFPGEIDPNEVKTGRSSPRVARGLSTLAYPRMRHAEFLAWIDEKVDQRPALVLVQEPSGDNNHLDFVVNSPGLQADVIFGRFRPDKTDLQSVRAAYSQRQLYLAVPERLTIKRID